MAKITRKNLKVFGDSGASGNFGKFGSLKAGAPVTSKDVEVLQGLPAWDNGWQDATIPVTIDSVTSQVPLLNDLNSTAYVHGYFLGYLLQEGIPEWNVLTSYYIGSIVKKTGTSELYMSRIDDNLGNSLPVQTDNINWAYLGTSQTRQAGEYKNKIINGNFDIWQRGINFTGSEYTADRWYAAAILGSITQQAFTLGQTDVPGEPTYFSRGTITSNSQGFQLFQQRIESVRTLAGKLATVSFYARLNSGSITFTPRLVQNFGTGGSPSSSVITNLGSFSPTGSWQKFIYTVAVPSITGKTLGTNNDDYLSFEFLIDNTNTGVLDLAKVQVEEGTIATEFEQRHLQQELALCQRFYEKSYNTGIYPGSISYNTGDCNFRVSQFNNYLSGNVNYKSIKRAIPTVTFYRPSTGTVNVIEDTAEGNPKTVTSFESGTNSMNIIGVSVAGTFGDVYQFHFTADAEL